MRSGFSSIASRSAPQRSRVIFDKLRCHSSMATDSSPSGRGGRAIVWFRGTDLRVHDNGVLSKAVVSLQRNESMDIVPLFCYDPRWFAPSRYGSPCKTGPHRAQFLIDSVNDLRKSLRALGSDLVVDVGPPEECIPKLVPPGASCTVFTQREVTSEEIAAERAVSKALPARSRLDLVWGSTLYHLDDLEFDVYKKMPTVFTPFRQKVESGSTVRPTLPRLKVGDLGSMPADIDVDGGRGGHIKRVDDLPTSVVPSPMKAPATDPRSAFTMVGGETIALERLKYYLFDSNIVSNYFNIRNGMLGGDYSTKLAPALAHGCISPRLIHSEISRYEREHGANKSTYWVIFELIWRDYFKFYALAQGSAIFLEGGPAGKHKVWEKDPGGEKFRRWKEGQTGWPLVDANMRELAATGFMSNRGRQNVASFLCLDLNLDWRLGADYFEHMLLDYDVASNWGNWVAAAGLTGGRVNKFNIVKQSKDYDKDGDYIRTWLPELANVPSEKIHEMKLSIKDRQAFGVDDSYPSAPMKSVFKYSSSEDKTASTRFGNKGGFKAKGKSRPHRRPSLADWE